MSRYAVLLSALVLCGCFNDPKSAPTAFKSDSHDHDHAHERDHKLIEDAGRYHAALTAHLSQKDGNELDLFFETISKTPKPQALPLSKFTAVARTATGQEHKLEFEPAPAEERKGDPEGKCSHFIAKAAWMKPEDVLAVTTTVPIDGKPTLIEWKNFGVKKYAHHAE